MSGQDEAKTDLIDDEIIWYDAVERAEDLFALAEEGARCLVLSEGVTYLYYGGSWRRLGPPPPRRNWRPDSNS
jgi:hypothetical protein